MATKKDKEGILFTPIAILASRPMSMRKVFINRNNKDKDKDDGQDEGKYFARIILTEANLKEPSWAAIKKELLAAGAAKFKMSEAAFAEGVKDGSYKWPLRKDLSKFGYDKTQFAAFINLNAYADNPPRLIGRDGMPITDFSLFKLGCKVRASVYVSAYDVKGNTGVNLKMRGVQFCGGVVPGLTLPTKGAGDAEDDFGAVGGPEDEEKDAKTAEAAEDDGDLNDLLG
jgi:hypothetical protein